MAKEVALETPPEPPINRQGCLPDEGMLEVAEVGLLLPSLFQ